MTKKLPFHLIFFIAALLGGLSYWAFLLHSAPGSPAPTLSLLLSPNQRRRVPPSILYCIATGSVVDRIDVLETLLDHALDWCEAGHRTKVIVDAHVEADVDYAALADELRAHRRCVASSLDITIIPHAVRRHSNDLVIIHRQHFQRELRHFDVFVFGEDDMAVRLATLRKWMQLTDQLRSVDLLVGLARYENSWLARRSRARLSVQRWRPAFQWTRNSSRSPGQHIPVNRVTWELPAHRLLLLNRSNTPSLPLHIPVNAFVWFNVTDEFRPPYAAAQIFTRAQLLSLQQACRFLPRLGVRAEYQQRGREFYSYTQPFTCIQHEVSYNVMRDGVPVQLNFTQANLTECVCCKTWVLPVRGFEALLLHHIGSPGRSADNKWSSRHRIHNSTHVSAWRHLLRQMVVEAEAGC